MTDPDAAGVAASPVGASGGAEMTVWDKGPDVLLA